MSEDMKKSLLFTLDFPPNFGGVAAYYHNICANFPSDRIVVLAPENPQAENFDSRQDFAVIRSNFTEFFPSSGRLGFFNRFKIYFYFWRMIKIIKSRKIELIQVGNILPLGTLALLIKKFRKVPYMIYTHGLDIVYAQNFWRKKLLLKIIIKEASAIVTNSNYTRGELIKLGADNKKIIIVYPCSDLELTHFDKVEIENFKTAHELQDKKILLTAGRLVERKGHDQVIKALPEILRSVPDAIYVIAGGGPDLDRLKNLAAEDKLDQHVRFLGAISRKDLALCYSLADVFIMPSRQLKNGDVEGFGIVYLEANIYGKPAIGGRSGGVPEAIDDGKTGILVDPENAEEIAQAAIRLLTDSAYAQALGSRGAQRVREEFNWKKQAGKIIEAIRAGFNQA